MTLEAEVGVYTGFKGLRIKYNTLKWSSKTGKPPLQVTLNTHTVTQHR